MGWGMWATGPKGGKLRPEILAKFRDAMAKVASVAESIDGDLGIGGLHISDCAYALRDMTGYDAYSDWTPNMVQGAWERAQSASIEDCPGHQLWAWHSAKEFLRVCAENNLQTQASW